MTIIKKVKKDNIIMRIKIFVFLIIFSIIFIISGFSQILGDVNNNGSVDIVDALLIAQYYVGYYVEYFYISQADVNCNGLIDIVDALVVCQYYVGIISGFPCATSAPTAVPTVAPTEIPTTVPTISPTAAPGEGVVNIVISSSTINIGGALSTQIFVSTGEKILKDFSFDISYSWTYIVPNTLIGNNGVIQAINVLLTSLSSTSTTDGSGTITISGTSNGILPGVNIPLFTIYWTAVGESTVNELEFCTNYLKDSNNAAMQIYPCIKQIIPITTSTIEPTTAPTTVPTSVPTPAPTLGDVIIAFGSQTELTCLQGIIFFTDIIINTGDKKLYTYDFTIEYDIMAIYIDPSLFNGDDFNGVQANKSNGAFISNVDRSTPGIIKINGYNQNGAGPFTNELFFKIGWFAKSVTSTYIQITPNSFLDINGNPIGSPKQNSVTLQIIATRPDNGSGIEFNAQYYSINPSGKTDSIQAKIIIRAEPVLIDTGIIPFELLKFRYYYTDEGATNETIRFKTFRNQVGISKIIYNKTPEYLEIGFEQDSGYMYWFEEIFDIDIIRSDNGMYDQTNDWSFDPRKFPIAYELWDHITVYYNGELKWGIEPPVNTPAPPPIPVKNLSCTVNFPNNFSNTANHWIPNTGDSLDSIGIRLFATGEDDTPIALAGSLADIVMLPPIDPNWEQNDVDATNPALQPNIHRNKGDCSYLLYAYNEGSGLTSGITSFYRNNQATEENNSFVIMERLSAGLRVDIDGNLYCYKDDKVFTKFGIRIWSYTSETIRPGDDLILRFALADDPRIVTIKNEGNFMAVYDKKLFWRAQAYIDETLNADGSLSNNIDWNNQNRWTFEQGNYWDRDWSDWDLDGVNNEPGPYQGGQPIIKPWTSIYTAFPSMEAWARDQGYPMEVHNAVAYSLGCDDTPYFFNNHLVELNGAIRAYYNASNDISVPPNDLPSQHRGWSAWNLTTAPEDEWGYYIHANPDTVTTVYNIVPPGNAVPSYPYAPGFSSFRKIFNESNNPDNSGIPDYDPDYFHIHTGYSSGVECQGLVARAAGYSNNTYTAVDPGDDNSTSWTHLTGQGQILPPNWLTVGWQITSLADEQTSLVIPGDVMMIDGHLTMVSKIIYDDNRNASSDQLFMIEACGLPMMVFNERTWSEILAATQRVTFCNILRLSMQ